MLVNLNMILHGEYYQHQKDYNNELQLLFELVDNGTWPIEVKFGNEVSLKIWACISLFPSMFTFTVTQLTLDSSLSSLPLADLLDSFCALSQTSPPECSPSPFWCRC